MKCICGNELEHSGSTSEDVKCPECGRVYNHRGQYLWREDDPEVPIGEGGFVEGPEAHGERRDPDEIAALEKAFEEAKLPEEDRREAEVEPEVVRVPARKKATNKK